MSRVKTLALGLVMWPLVVFGWPILAWFLERKERNMSITRQILQFFIDLANAGMGVDKDGVYGYQCADVPSYAVKQWLGLDLWGNAIDLLDSAAENGLRVVYAGQEAIRPGAFFVMDYWAGGVNYGHTGLVIEVLDGGLVRTVEQNLAGNLEVGSPAQFNVRSADSFNGWFYADDEVVSSAMSQIPTSHEIELTPEQGVFTVGADAINVRRAPNLLGEVVDVYRQGQSVVYDSKGSANGYRWISYVGGSGKRNYMAIGQVDEAGNRISLWGEID